MQVEQVDYRISNPLSNEQNATVLAGARVRQHEFWLLFTARGAAHSNNSGRYLKFALQNRPSLLNHVLTKRAVYARFWAVNSNTCSHKIKKCKQKTVAQSKIV